MLLSVSVLAAGSVAGGFGQFAFTHQHVLATFEVGPAAFRANAPSAVEIRFGPERTGFNARRLTRYMKTLSMRPEPRAPLRIAFETTSLGFSPEFRDGLRFEASGIVPPFITWAEGSVGPGVPSAPSRWALLSWPTPHPPILLVFPTRPASLIARRTERGFVLEAQEGYSGWVRVRAPFGMTEIAATSASELGRLVERITPHLERLTAPAPKLVGFSVEEDSNGLTAVWRFDRPGALVPAPLIARRRSGNVKLLSGLRRAGASESGDLWECEGTELNVRFLARRLPPGAAVVRPPSSPPALPATVSHIDAESVADAAMLRLSGLADELLTNSLATAVQAFGEERRRDREPVTGSPIMFDRSGRGSRLAAAHALAVAAALGEPVSSQDGLLGSIDWVTWLPAGQDERERLEAAAILAVAAALSNSPEDRVLGAMAETAVAASGGPLLHPFHILRAWIYPHPSRLSLRPPGWWTALQSPVRTLSAGVKARAEGNSVLIEGLALNTDPIEVRFRSDAPLAAADSLNLSDVQIREDAGEFRFLLRPDRPGVWRLRLSRPSSSAPIPMGAPGPGYSEAPR